MVVGSSHGLQQAVPTARCKLSHLFTNGKRYYVWRFSTISVFKSQEKKLVVNVNRVMKMRMTSHQMSKVPFALEMCWKVNPSIDWASRWSGNGRVNGWGGWQVLSGRNLLTPPSPWSRHCTKVLKIVQNEFSTDEIHILFSNVPPHVSFMFSVNSNNTTTDHLIN